MRQAKKAQRHSSSSKQSHAKLAIDGLRPSEPGEKAWEEKTCRT